MSTDATLGGLILEELDRTEIALSPAFASTTTSYMASLANSVGKITIDLTAKDSRATVAYLDANDATLTDTDANEDYFQVALSVGANTIKIKVTADDGVTTETYTVAVTRGAVSTDTTLSAPGLSDAPGGETIILTPGGNRTYTASVANSVSSVTLTATKNDSDATVVITGDDEPAAHQGSRRDAHRPRAGMVHGRMPVLSVGRAGTSTVARKVNAVTGPTPGTVIRRRQTGSTRTASSIIL